MAGGKRARGCDAPMDDQEAFIRENAVVLVREKNEKIARLRKRVTQLEQSLRDVRKELAKRPALP
jgi:uncharacterized protein involved in exopolysaccharide biosynthesis